MKRLILFTVFAICISAFLHAQKGIRIESSGAPIVVYVNDSPMCTPVNSCFISNLDRGVYHIEVYTADNSHKRRSKPVYSEKVRYSGFGIEEIVIETRNETGNRPHHPQHPRGRFMSENAYNELIKSIKSASFDDTRNTIIKPVLTTTDFTSEQAKELAVLFDFDNERIKFAKMIYPNVIDKTDFFIIMDTFDFDSSKKEISKFIEGYHK